MKINGVEIDMQKVLQVHEAEEKRYKLTKEHKKKISDWWDTEPGMIMRDKLRESMAKKNIHRHRIEYLITDIDTGEQFALSGQDELANFLGYAQFNSQMRGKEYLENKTKTKTFKINIM